MNRSEELFNNLSNLADNEDLPFYRVVHEGPFDGATYHVFSYRIGSYTDFLEPDALECRGHMFRVEGDEAVLVSLPFPKFFKRGENPFTMDLDFSNDNIEHIAVKEDGYLISTYLDANGDLRLKSKTSLTSTMAMESMKLLPRMWNSDALELVDICNRLENDGYTVIMEYVSPKNRIVLPYDNCSLVVLGVRNRETLEMLTYEQMKSDEFYNIVSYASHNVKEDHTGNFKDWVDAIPQMKGIEGFVIRLKDGMMVKCKTDEYVSLHHAKDSINSPRRLMDVVIQEASDDLRQMFSDDPQALAEIDHMERFVSDTVNHLVKPVDTFYEANKHLERKDYAIKGQEELRRDQFTLAMGKYSGKEIDYKQYISKNHKDYLQDYETTLTTEETEE